jgi:hypothetical protein
MLLIDTRVFLAYVLKHHTQLKVTCIVRAENKVAAMDRVKDALEGAGYWKDSYANNILYIAFIRIIILCRFDFSLFFFFPPLFGFTLGLFFN